MKACLLTMLLCGASLLASAQDPEFPRGEFIMHLRLHNGMITSFRSAPDVYVGGLQLVPQWTVVANRIRVGLVAGGLYTGKKLQGQAGPTVSVKLKSFRLKEFGSGGNIHLSLDHLWVTQAQQLLGGSINLDLLNLLVTGLSVHRDYHLNSWWFQGTIAFRISRTKQIPHP